MSKIFRLNLLCCVEFCSIYTESKAIQVIDHEVILLVKIIIYTLIYTRKIHDKEPSIGDGGQR